MFELILNAVKLALSSDARETASAILNRLMQSPDWKNAFCTLEATIPLQESERASVLLHLASEKIRGDGFPEQSVHYFNSAADEIITNIFEHAVPIAKGKAIKLLIETTPTYISLTAFNPERVPVQLKRWIDFAAQHLKITEKRGRGRGLAFSIQCADTLEQIGQDALKIVVYRDTVELKRVRHEQHTLLFVISGHSNPSLGRRLVEVIEHSESDRYVIIFEPDEYLRYTGHKGSVRLDIDRRQLHLGGFEMTRVEMMQRNAREEGGDRRSKKRSQAIGRVLQATENMNRPIKVLFVTADEAMNALLPEDVAYRYLKDALNKDKKSNS